MRYVLWLTLSAIMVGSCPGGAYANSPFITDDARVVGARLAQLESWLQVDKDVFQHWFLPALGINNRLELTIGGVHGRAQSTNGGSAYSLAGPLLQVKALAWPEVLLGIPGVALSVGALAPAGRGGFKAPGWIWFGYVALTEKLLDDDELLVHANLGGGNRRDGSGRSTTLTWGVGAQIHLLAGLHGLGEVLYGDAYSGTEDGAVHGGFRYAFNKNVQLDSAVGRGVWGNPRRPLWGTVGVRLISSPLW